MRRYQWVILAGLFAVLSNVVVASVLAFAVITVPPTSLKATRSELGSLDAVLLKRQIAISNAKGSVIATFRETQRIAAFSATRNFTSLGLATALEALTSEQDQEAEVNRLMKLMEKAKTAFAPIIEHNMLIAMQDIRAILAAGPESVPLN